MAVRFRFAIPASVTSPKTVLSLPLNGDQNTEELSTADPKCRIRRCNRRSRFRAHSARRYDQRIGQALGERLGRVTIWVGALVLRPTDTAQSLIERADNCLHPAKRNRRNRMIC
jgi:GGDEF domain-containing protein